MPNSCAGATWRLTCLRFLFLACISFALDFLFIRLGIVVLYPVVLWRENDSPLFF